MRKYIMIVAFLLININLSFSSYMCYINIGDDFVRDYSYPRDVFYVNILYPDGQLFGYDPVKKKMVGYVKMYTQEFNAERGNSPSWPLFDNAKTEYTYVNSQGFNITKFPAVEGVEGGKRLLGYAVDCAEGKNIIRIIPNEPAIVGWGARVWYDEWNNVLNGQLEYYFDPLIVSEGMSGSFVITPAMGQREFVFYVDRDYRKVKIEAKVSPEMLIEDLKGCADLGLIKNYGVLNSLFSKLQNADRLYRLGRIKEAQNIIKAFGHELSAQKGKHIDEQCVSAVQTDVSFFMGVNIVQESLKKYMMENR
mgnify:CR=1 FL=1